MVMIMNLLRFRCVFLTVGTGLRLRNKFILFLIVSPALTLIGVMIGDNSLLLIHPGASVASLLTGIVGGFGFVLVLFPILLLLRIILLLRLHLSGKDLNNLIKISGHFIRVVEQILTLVVFLKLLRNHRRHGTFEYITHFH